MNNGQISRIGIKISEDGNVYNIAVPKCWEVLRRLYERNNDPTSPDFECLTWVQSRALYEVLVRNNIGVSVSKLRGQRNADDEVFE